ncbi:RuvC-like resolvase [Rhodococcus phage Weasels2]|uniref:RuvC-like resolvase n=1 Tax=Rhodococcus phage Weasels2 TaxID=1897437 RepID=A0A1I9SA92_9CAUD|nr:RuvC-like resolvase [Rhodococcus phage Weasels2]AOZ63698.1 RuvC-like resolvase [Rhodococcus phage Weasels2]
MRILSIDCSTNSFAYGVIVDDVVESYGEIYFVGSTLNHRLKDARQKMEAFLPDFQAMDIDYIIFEEVVKVRSMKTYASMAKMFGVAISVLMEIGPQIILVEPLKWQEAIGVTSPRGRKRAEMVEGLPELKTKAQIDKYIREFRKQKIMDFVKETVGVETDSDNISDAIAIGLFARQILKDGSF